MSEKVTVEDLRNHCTEKSAWIAIRGKVYDVTAFMRRHPGGRDALLLAIGRDATVVFETYHDLERVKKVLEKMPLVGHLVDSKTPSFSEVSPFQKAINDKVRKRFKEARLDAKNAPAAWVTYAVILITLWASYYQQFFGLMSHSLLFQTIAALINGIASAQIGLHVLHDSSHFSITHRPLVWKLLGATHDFCNGLSFVWWSYRHVFGHHPCTNIVDADPDIYVDTRANFQRILRFQPWRHFYKYQHIYSPFVYGGLGFKMRYQDLEVLYVKKSRGSIAVNPLTFGQHLQLLGGKAFFLFYRLVLPVLLGHSFVRVLMLLLFSDLMMSYFLALPFQANHVVGEVQLPFQQTSDIDWAKMQIATSLDYAIDSKVTRFAVGSLNFQTVHHLFPGILQHHYPLIHDIIRDECEKNGVRYNIKASLFGALNAHIQHLRNLGARA